MDTAPGQYPLSGGSAAEVARSVERAVAAGRLLPDGPLPSVRALADRLGLAPGTVASAYTTLRDRGVVVTAGRSGTRVAPARAETVPLASAPLPAGVVDVRSGNPDPALLPDLRPHLRALAEEPGGDARLYGSPPVLPRLAEVAGPRLGSDGVPAAHLAVTSGALDGIGLALATVLRPGDAVAVEDPGWVRVLELCRARGWRPVPVGLDAEGPRPDALRGALTAGARAAVVTLRAQNPTGADVTPARADALGGVLAAHPDVLLVEDDHSVELATEALAPLPAAGGASRPPRWVHVRATAKTLGPDLRLAVLAGDEQTIARVGAGQRVATGWVAGLLQGLVARLWEDPSVATLLADARLVLARRRAALLDPLRDAGLPATGTSGMNVWLPVADEAAVVAGLRERGWAAQQGAPYRLLSGPGVRLTTASLTSDQAERLAADVVAVLGAGASALS